MVRKAQKLHGARSGLYGECSNGVPLIHFFQAEHTSEARNFEVINGLQHVFEEEVERCKKCIACQRRYFKKETHHLSTKL
jgi:hypothetical protein